MQGHVVGRAQGRAIPSPGARHVAALLLPRRLEQGELMHGSQGLVQLRGIEVRRQGRVERIGPLGPEAIPVHRLAVLLDPSADRRVGLRPGGVEVDLLRVRLAGRVQRL